MAIESFIAGILAGGSLGALLYAADIGNRATIFIAALFSVVFLGMGIYLIRKWKQEAKCIFCSNEEIEVHLCSECYRQSWQALTQQTTHETQ